jgi:hypothetical protein
MIAFLSVGGTKAAIPRAGVTHASNVQRPDRRGRQISSTVSATASWQAENLSGGESEEY